MWLGATNRSITPAAQALSGLDFAGNETESVQRGLFVLSPPAAYDMTFVLRVFPRGPKSPDLSHYAYWTAFFWGNYGAFNSGDTYYGGHPYPFDGAQTATGQNWEISVNGFDVPPNETPGGNSGAATWNRWYTQVFRAYIVGGVRHHDYVYDWDLFVSSSGASGVFSYSHGNAFPNPPTPSIVIGEAAPNGVAGESWGGYAGYEQFKGVIRGLQLYSARVGAAGSGSASASGGNHPTLANLSDVASEIATPGSVLAPWFLNLNPTPTDITDKSGSGHHFSWAHATNRPALWTG